MTQLNQVAGTHLLDVPVHNYGESTLTTAFAVILDTSNTGGANTAVGVTLPASDANAFGILVESIPTLRTGRCRVQGIAPCTASGTVHVGDYLKTDSTGSVLKATAGTYVIGICMSEGVSGDIVNVLIDRSKNA